MAKALPVQPTPPLPATGTDKTNTTTTDLASMMFYSKRTVSDKTTWEGLSNEDRKVFIEQAEVFVQALNKLNLRVVKSISEASEQETRDKRLRNIEVLTQIIRTFLKGIKTTKPELFPADELAHRILDGKL